MKRFHFPSFDSASLKRTALFALIFIFAAHAFCFFNLTYSGSSVMLDVSRSRNAQIAGGQYLQTIYWRVRGALSAPLFVGMLSALYLTLTVMVTAWLLRLKRPLHLFVLSGLMTANAAVTSLCAASLSTADASFLALLLASCAGACCARIRFGFLPGSALLTAALGLDTNAAAFFAGLVWIALVLDLADSRSARTFAAGALKAALALALGAAVYTLGYLLMCRRSGLQPQAALRWAEGGMYLAPIRAILSPLTAYAKLSVVLRLLLALLAVFALIRLARGLGPALASLLAACALALPLLCSLPAFSSSAAAQITPAHCLLDVFVLALIARAFAPAKRLQLLAASGFSVLLLGCIVFSNQVYLKKNLEFESTLSLTSRIIQRAEETEGYQPGFTPVAILGTIEDSAFSVKRKGFEHLAALDAASANYAVTTDEEMIWYCWEILGYPFSFIGGYEKEQLAASDAVKAMPAFPAEGCAAMHDGVLVIKIN